jgi:hypothetical protein
MKKIKYLIMLFYIPYLCYAVDLTSSQADYIAQRIWQNEGSGKDKYLLWWNKGENFASLGIGHFIWYPKDIHERFLEVFPLFLEYLRQKNITLPPNITPQTDLPWQNRRMFLKAKRDMNRTYKKLFTFLKNTKHYQAMFMADRMQKALPKLLQATKEKKNVKRRFYRLFYQNNSILPDKQGLYILIDYINFKGEGILASERYHNKGWGLLQVLENMNDNTKNKYKAFADSAKKILLRRILNAPSSRGESRWKKGWFNRIDTYWKQTTY